MKSLKDAVLNIDKDFMNYSAMDDIEEYDTLNDYFISHLEHELDIYYECKEYDMDNISWVTKDNIRKVKRVIDNYYNGKYKGE